MSDSTSPPLRAATNVAAPQVPRAGADRTLAALVLVAKAIFALALVLVILAFGSVLVPAILGRQALLVYGGSMEPTIPVGSIVVLDKVSPEDLRPGDIITFARATNPNVQITHRVIAVDDGPAGLQLRTKGDANETAD